jgi:ankyrin repeat protein
MTRSLPLHPSLENLKKRAKALKRAWQSGDAHALERVRAAHPKLGSEEALQQATSRLTDCQLVLAREAGFASWPQLRIAVEAAQHDLPDEFVTLACLCYDDPHYDHRMFHARASEMLRNHPWLASANIWCAAAVGSAAAVAAILNEEPDAVNRTGPYGWMPLLCACYSRVTPVEISELRISEPGVNHSTYEAAKLLLDRGADANAYTMKGDADERLDQTPRRFTALTGLVGGGSTGLANQPPHPRWRELAELLLERGADPADEWALWIHPAASLELLLHHGLKPEARTADGAITLMGRELSRAALEGHLDRVKLLLQHGARADEVFRGRTPWQHAMDRGNLEIARLLEEAGAPMARLSDLEELMSLCLAGDAAGVRALLERAPDVVQRAGFMVNKAVSTRRIEAVRLALDLGFDPNFMDEVAPLHIASGGGGDTGWLREADKEIVDLLLERGGSLEVREPFYDGTPIGWAGFFDHVAMRDFLLSKERISIFDALEFDRLDRIADIVARDPEALERPFARCLTREPKAEDWQTPLVRMVSQGKIEAVRVLLAHGADAAARHPDGRSLTQVAQEKGFHEIAALLQEYAVKT